MERGRKKEGGGESEEERVRRREGAGEREEE